MKATTLKLTTMIAAIALVVPAGTTLAQEDADNWQDLKDESKRMKVNEMADASLKELFVASPKAKELYGAAHGYAVFDNMKFAIGISGGGGNGVAVDKSSGARTYMKMGTVGIGLGLGGKKYQVVFLFQDQQTFTGFVEKGWQADAGAGAVAGTASADVTTGFTNGLAIFQLTDKGLMAAADVAGTKYWKNKKLNN